MQLEPLVKALTREIFPHLDRPFALFGHSMGAMISFELARRLRADPRGRGVILIALTGYGQHETRARALDAGFDAFLVKPLAADELERILTAAR